MSDMEKQAGEARKVADHDKGMQCAWREHNAEIGGWVAVESPRDAFCAGFRAGMEAKSAAVAADERERARIMEIANLFGVPDGGRYLNDWIATAEKYRAALAAKAAPGGDVIALIENYANSASWTWEGDGYTWAGGKWDYRRDPTLDAKAAIAALSTPAPTAQRGNTGEAAADDDLYFCSFTADGEHSPSAMGNDCIYCECKDRPYKLRPAALPDSKLASQPGNRDGGEVGK